MNRLPSIVAIVVCTAAILMDAQAGFAGKWQGTTGSGRTVTLDVEVKKQELTGTLTVGQQTADIVEGKAEEKAFSFKATIEERTVTFTGRLVGEEIELTPQGAANPVTLKRMK